MKGGFKLLWIIWSDDLIWFGLIINDLIWYNIFFLQEDFQSSTRMNILITAERWKIKEHIFSLVPIFPWKLLPSFSSQKGENPNMDPQKSPHINSEKTFHFVHFLTRYYLNSSSVSNFFAVYENLEINKLSVKGNLLLNGKMNNFGQQIPILP